MVVATVMAGVNASLSGPRGSPVGAATQGAQIGVVADITRGTSRADVDRAVTKARASEIQVLGVHAYALWNEPNNSRFWPSGPNAADYASLLRAA